MSNVPIRRSVLGSLVIVALAVTFWSAVGQAGPTPTPTAEPTATPIPTPTATPTATPIPTPIPTPTGTPIPTATPPRYCRTCRLPVTPTPTSTGTPSATPISSEKVTMCHKGKNLISLPANAVPGHLAHGDTLGADQCLECEFPISGTFCACNDSWPKCMVIPPICPLGTVLAAQNHCWACVDPFTCRPVEQ